jgi:hypothetical protein
MRYLGVSFIPIDLPHGMGRAKIRFYSLKSAPTMSESWKIVDLDDIKEGKIQYFSA